MFSKKNVNCSTDEFYARTYHNPVLSKNILTDSAAITRNRAKVTECMFAKIVNTQNIPIEYFAPFYNNLL